MKRTKQHKTLLEKYSPEFLEFADDTYAYLAKYSGKKFAETLGVSRQAFADRKRKREDKNENK